MILPSDPPFGFDWSSHNTYSTNVLHRHSEQRTDEALVLTGRDKAYQRASKMGLLFIPYDKDQPIELRTARHVTGVRLGIEMLGQVKPGKDVVVDNIPSYKDLTSKGLGPWLGVVKN